MCISDISESLGNGPGKSMWDLLVTLEGCLLLLIHLLHRLYLCTFPADLKIQFSVTLAYVFILT